MKEKGWNRPLETMQLCNQSSIKTKIGSWNSNLKSPNRQLRESRKCHSRTKERQCWRRVHWSRGAGAETGQVEEAAGDGESGHRGLRFSGEGAPAARDIYFLNTVYRFLVLVR